MKVAVDVEAPGHDSELRMDEDVFVAQPNVLGPNLMQARLGGRMLEIEFPLVGCTFDFVLNGPSRGPHKLIHCHKTSNLLSKPATR